MSEERGSGLNNNFAVGVEAASSCSLPNLQARFDDNYSPSLLRNLPQHHHPKLQQHQHPRSKPACSRPATARQQRKWVIGGPGMQAVFLDSETNNKSSSCGGTGVFLPHIHQLHPTRKPACSPVLLPSRVVQALNLNVQDLGLKITGARKESDEFSMRKKKVAADQKREETIWEPSHVFTEKECLFPDIFLPKEWTY